MAIPATDYDEQDSRDARRPHEIRIEEASDSVRLARSPLEQNVPQQQNPYMMIEYSNSQEHTNQRGGQNAMETSGETSHSALVSQTKVEAAKVVDGVGPAPGGLPQ